MGMPACTITSQTAHGGIVTVGFPTVLIGGLPASRIGDLHVCPMVTGVVPHVGGPFILGSPTVLVGNMPQSRVTDQLTCVGPPDVAVMGCETVLVGMAGAGGAAGAMGGAAAMGVPVPVVPPPTSSSTSQTQMLGDGTSKTSAPEDARLPAAPLQQQGWPDLPAEHAPNFQSAQPVDLPPGTLIQRVIPNASKAQGPYWALWIPGDEETWRSAYAVLDEFNPDGLVVQYRVPPEGLKCWMGPASSQRSEAQKLKGGGMQFYMPHGTAKTQEKDITPSPWAARRSA